MSDDELPPKEPGEKCNARKTDGSDYCRQPAGFGTDHVGHGRCKYHGGNTEAQEQNVADELEDASEHAAVALRLRLKHVRQRLEEGEDVDATELSKLGKMALDYAPSAPNKTEKRDVTLDADVDATHDVTAEFVTYSSDEGGEDDGDE